MGEGREQPMIAEQGPSCNAEETFSHLVAEYRVTFDDPAGVMTNHEIEVFPANNGNG